jgi:hypothetical protein
MLNWRSGQRVRFLACCRRNFPTRGIDYTSVHPIGGRFLSESTRRLDMRSQRTPYSHRKIAVNGPTAAISTLELPMRTASFDRGTLASWHSAIGHINHRDTWGRWCRPGRACRIVT